WNQKVFLPLTFGSTFRRSLGRADVVHLFDFRSYLNAVAVNALERKNTPYVFSAFGELPRATGIKRPIKVIYDLIFGYRILKNAHFLLAQTEDEAEWYRRFGAREEQIRIVPLAVDLKELEDLPAKGGFR